MESGTLIVPLLQRGNAAQDAPRPLSNVTQSVTGGIPTQSVGTISVDTDLCITTSAEQWARSVSR